MSAMLPILNRWRTFGTIPILAITWRTIVRQTVGRNFEVVLQPHADEVKELCTNGITFNGQKYPVMVYAVVNDGVADTDVRCSKGKGWEIGSCHACQVVNEYSTIRKKMIHPFYTASIAPRTDFQFRNGGVDRVGTTPLLQIPDLNMVDDFPVDPMHAVYIGILKRMMYVWLGVMYPRGSRLQCRLTPALKQVTFVKEIKCDAHAWARWSQLAKETPTEQRTGTDREELEDIIRNYARRVVDSTWRGESPGLTVFRTSGLSPRVLTSPRQLDSDGDTPHANTIPSTQAPDPFAFTSNSPSPTQDPFAEVDRTTAASSAEVEGRGPPSDYLQGRVTTTEAAVYGGLLSVALLLLGISLGICCVCCCRGRKSPCDWWTRYPAVSDDCKCGCSTCRSAQCQHDRPPES